MAAVDARAPKTSSSVRKPTTVVSQNRPYKAIVVLYLGGGTDSWQVLLPKSDTCSGHDIYAEYAKARPQSGATLSRDELLEIEAPAGTQPCEKFGINPALPFLQKLYNDGDAAFIANMGALVEPLNKGNYKTADKPKGLFSHNTQQDTVQTANGDEPRYATAYTCMCLKATRVHAHECVCLYV